MPMELNNSETSRRCHQCGAINEKQHFCGNCGAPLALDEFISKKVKEQVGEAVRDRDVLEMDSSIKVFKQAWEWMRLIGGIAIALLVLAGGGVIWKISDFWSGVSQARQSVIDTAKKSSDEITSSSLQSRRGISGALDTAKAAITAAASDAVHQSQSLKASASQTQAEILRQAAALRRDIDESRQQLQSASKIQPQIADMRRQLAQATSDIQAQQKAMSSSQEFVKTVFSSHRVEYFNIGQSANDRYGIILPPKDGNRTVVFLLLQSAPIPQTLQLQYHIFAQPQNSYFVIHNLVIFFWGDSADALKSKQLSVSYFPDNTDRQLFRSLSEHDGRVFADGEPLPKLNQPDPGFKGTLRMSQP